MLLTWASKQDEVAMELRHVRESQAALQQLVMDITSMLESGNGTPGASKIVFIAA